MRRKIAGKLNQPPPQAEFDAIALNGYCRTISGEFYRLHSTDRDGKPWPPVYFSKRGNSRFDSKTGVGVLCVGKSLAGTMMEIFDDYWGLVGSLGRSVTEAQLKEMWAIRVSLPSVLLFDATGKNLSKIGTDAQFLTGKYTTTRKWAKRLMDHKDRIDGVHFRSRHDPDRLNIALFQRAPFLPAIHDADLLPSEPDPWTREPGHGSALIYGSSGLETGMTSRRASIPTRQRSVSSISPISCRRNST